MSDFQQTVDLREKMERPKKTATPLEKIYRGEDAAETQRGASVETQRIASLQTISRPKVKTRRGASVETQRLASLLAVFILAILLAGATVYFLFFKTKSAVVSPKAKDWYAVKLVDGEVFYGQIEDTKADPVVMANVYYNYDQAKAKEAGAGAAENSGNLRLVKRGKETHGPAGTMDIVRTQVLFMEPLKSDSKVLKAILEYEK